MTKRSIYHDRMLRYLNVLAFASLSFTLFACGNTSDVALIDEVRDAVAFRAVGETTVSVMAPDGAPLDIDRDAAEAVDWPERNTIIGQVCGFFKEANEDTPIVLVSPDGAVLGPPKPDWLPAISPDGLFAAFACFLDRDADGEPFVVVVDEGGSGEVRKDWSRTTTGKSSGSDRVELKVVKLDGSLVRDITLNYHGDWLPSWSPNGLQLVYETNRDGNSEVYVVDADGRNTRNLTNHEANDLWPTWSRDGHLVAFSSSRSGSEEIFVQPMVGEASPTGRQGHPVPWAR
jgi:hypothetical protein